MFEGIKILGVEVSHRACRLIMTTAVEGGLDGISYWANVKLLTRSQEDDLIEHFTLQDAEGNLDKVYEVTNSSINVAVKRLICDPESCDLPSTPHGLMDQDHFDANVADLVIQVACFGKVIYG